MTEANHHTAVVKLETLRESDTSDYEARVVLPIVNHEDIDKKIERQSSIQNSEDGVESSSDSASSDDEYGLIEQKRISA